MMSRCRSVTRCSAAAFGPCACSGKKAARGSSTLATKPRSMAIPTSSYTTDFVTDATLMRLEAVVLPDNSRVKPSPTE